MNDRVFIENLRLKCKIGASVKERRKPQEVVMDLSLFVDLRRAGSSDRLASTIDYRRVVKLVTELASGREFRLLEGLGEAVAASALGMPRVERVVVKLRKAKYSDAPAMGIEIERISKVG